MTLLALHHVGKQGPGELYGTKIIDVNRSFDFNVSRVGVVRQRHVVIRRIIDQDVDVPFPTPVPVFFFLRVRGAGPHPSEVSSYGLHRPPFAVKTRLQFCVTAGRQNYIGSGCQQVGYQGFPDAR